jgi:hypothetical protein
MLGGCFIVNWSAEKHKAIAIRAISSKGFISESYIWIYNKYITTFNIAIDFNN